MNFVFKMAWRDSRTARRRLVLFSLSIVLGVAALVAIGSFSANLRQAIDDQSKGLLGADLAVTSRSAVTPEAQAFLDGLGGEQAKETTFSSMVVFPSAGNQTRLITVRALEGGYPFYGVVKTNPADGFARLPQGDAVVVEETLLRQFGLKAGDPLKLGEKTFTIAGGLEQLPGDSAAVATLSPRVLVARSALAETGLMGRGSLVRHRAYFKFGPERDVERFVADNRARFRELRLSVDTVEERRRELGQSLQNVQGFLSLVGFVALVLGAIGVASAIHVYVRQKITTVAVLRCLGASAWQSFGVYLVQGLALGVIGALAGTVLGVAVQLALPALVKGMLPFEIDFFVSWAAVARGLLAGVGVGVLFTLLPLLAVRRVSPLVAIRSAFAERAGQGDPLRWAVYAAILAAVTGFAIWQTQRVSWGLGFTGALLVSFAVLAGSARVVAWLARRFLPKGLPYVWRQGVANLHRPNNRTVLLLLSLGLGTFLLLTLSLARETLLSQIRDSGDGARPNLLFFDIQDDQIEPLGAVLAKQGVPVQASAPIVTMRLRSLKGRAVEELLLDESVRIPAWTLRREYRSTFRGELTTTETVIGGTFTGRATENDTVIPISMEEGLAKDMQLTLGDELEFDVQGVPVASRVTSLRRVDWKRLSPNFFVVFPEGVLEAAPKFYVVAARANGAAESAKAQQAVVTAFPNVSALDLALVMQTLDGIFSKVQFVVQFMSLFTVATGVIVLAGAVMTGRFQRVRETVLLRTLGASRAQLMQIQLVEYAVLGVLGALVGGGLAYGANAALAIWVFKAPVILPVMPLVLSVVLVTGLTLATGLLSGRGITRQPPLEVLRQEA
ncbi:ABC transporter permease [Rariglobus hedericola]|uniref:FtsX-like permease family protein n=1 Tax=Rariglobus hedericola TaxID=2597822 RepID=A0A556QK13_9BACT|nr:FtsX-like permease family protein [Rariglobus hedericola]TSJ76961.1 FtsX-like permease family protein [Rariglobus hedericola]